MSRPRSTTPPVEPQYLQVARHIETAIAAGTYRHGERLPSTRDLAREWDTSPFTINEAMALLIKKELVVSKSRTSRIVNAPDQATRAARTEIEKPQVLFVGGYAGSGKTELGRILARLTKWGMFDKDTITRPVVEAALSTMGLSVNDRESEEYLSKVRPREYEALEASIVENLECANSVIATAPFLREFKDDAWLSRMKARIEGFGATMSIAWVYCDVDTMHFYLRARGAARDAKKLEGWPEYLSEIDVAFRPSVPHFIINNSTSVTTPLQTQAVDLIDELVARSKVSQ